MDLSIHTQGVQLIFKVFGTGCVNMLCQTTYERVCGQYVFVFQVEVALHPALLKSRSEDNDIKSNVCIYRYVTSI